jgi:hypothetical protein
MPGGQRATPITDFLFRLEVDSAFVNTFIDNPDDAFDEYGLDDGARLAISAGDWKALQELVDAEHPDRVHIIPRGWVK